MLVEPRTVQVQGRDAALANLLSLLRSRRHYSQIVLGPEGSGRTSLASALALELSKIRSGPIAGLSVTLLRAEEILAAQEPGVWIQEQVENAGDESVVFIDDIDIATTVGSEFGVNREVVISLKIVLQRKDRRIILSSTPNASQLLNEAFPTLMSGIFITELQPLDEDTVRSIVEDYARKLSAYHEVNLNQADITAACLPQTENDRLAHPTLAISRIDHAMATSAHFKDSSTPKNTVWGADDWHSEKSPRTFGEFIAKTEIKRHIKGQDHVVDAIVEHVSVCEAGFRLRPSRPVGVFMLAGPTGVGKTAFALRLAEQVFGSQESVVRLDMSEFTDKYATARLIGPPPGYLGNDRPEEWLTTKIINNPRQVLLLDEFEKADPQVWQIFLQVFDAGRLTDGRGAVADFSQTLVLLTSNIGAEAFADRPSVGFTQQQTRDSRDDHESVMRSLEQRLAPELINRFDQVLVFQPLSFESMLEITRAQLQRVQLMAKEQQTEVEFNDDAVDFLARAGYSRSYGARPLGRVIQKLVLWPLRQLDAGRYRVKVTDGQLRFVDEEDEELQ